MQKADYIIVGKGIAGSVLALMLLRRNKKLIVIDEPHLSSSSKVAKGTWNPFNFRRMNIGVLTEDFIRAAEKFYANAEQSAGKKILQPRRILKVFFDENEHDQWQQLIAENKFSFCRLTLTENPFPAVVHAPFGMGYVHRAANVDVGLLLQLAEANVKDNGLLCEEKFVYDKLELKSEGAVYDQKFSAPKVIFCEGNLVQQNPWFSYLPLQPVKGQVLQVRIPGLETNDIINRGLYLVPLGNEKFAAGATYENDIDDEQITGEGKEEIIDKLSKFIRAEIHVENQFAGVRPSVRDRHPLLGLHPEHPQLVVFNGLGSKGVLQSPLLAGQLVEFLEDGKALPAEIDVGRVQK